jgi:Holliday junction resolvasome RuvABC DNA-binding subunit
MLQNITLLIAFIATLFVLVKFEKIFLPVGIALALIMVVKVFQENAQKFAMRELALTELVGALQHEGYSEEQIDAMLAARNLKRPENSVDAATEALTKEGYTEEQVKAIFAGRRLEQQPPAQAVEPRQ